MQPLARESRPARVLIAPANGRLQGITADLYAFETLTFYFVGRDLTRVAMLILQSRMR